MSESYQSTPEWKPIMPATTLHVSWSEYTTPTQHSLFDTTTQEFVKLLIRLKLTIIAVGLSFPSFDFVFSTKF